MATTTFQDQPSQADEMISAASVSPPYGADPQPHEDCVASSLEDAMPDTIIPDTKSGVRVDPAAVMASARFKKGDVVQKPVIVNGMRTKGVFTVYNRRANPAGYIEYQLKSLYNLQVESGWTREKELKPGS